MTDLQNPSIEELRVWTQTEHEFHGTLSAACGSTPLIAAQRDAFIRFRLHLVSVDPGWGLRGEHGLCEHETILTAAMNRDATDCAEAIRFHFSLFPKALVALKLAESA